mgnify:FL=1
MDPEQARLIPFTQRFLSEGNNGTIYCYGHELRSLLCRVEKAVTAVPGVTSCSVSLLTNSMGVEGTASASAIVKAVQEAGYGASPRLLPPRPPAPSWMHWLTTKHPD